MSCCNKGPIANTRDKLVVGQETETTSGSGSYSTYQLITGMITIDCATYESTGDARIKEAVLREIAPTTLSEKSFTIVLARNPFGNTLAGTAFDLGSNSGDDYIEHNVPSSTFNKLTALISSAHAKDINKTLDATVANTLYACCIAAESYTFESGHIFNFSIKLQHT